MILKVLAIASLGQPALRFGLLLCREIDNRVLFLKRCTDTFRDGRGLIIPLTDEDLKIILVNLKNKIFIRDNYFMDLQKKIVLN